MIVLAGLAIGAVYGALQAKKRGGRKLDQMQYGAAYGILCAIIGLVLTIIIGRIA